MKEAIGGSYIFEIVIVFIALFSAFLVYSISYTKAFKVKNEIISLIEQNQGYTLMANDANISLMTDQELIDDGSVEAEAYRRIVNYGYKHDILDGNSDLCYMNGTNVNIAAGDNLKGDMMPGGYCLYKLCSRDKTMNTTYKVVAFIALKIPIMNVVVRVPIAGETRTIYSDNGAMKCSNGSNDSDGGE